MSYLKLKLCSTASCQPKFVCTGLVAQPADSGVCHRRTMGPIKKTEIVNRRFKPPDNSVKRNKFARRVVSAHRKYVATWCYCHSPSACWNAHSTQTQKRRLKIGCGHDMPWATQHLQTIWLVLTHSIITATSEPMVQQLIPCCRHTRWWNEYHTYTDVLRVTLSKRVKSCTAAEAAVVMVMVMWWQHMLLRVWDYLYMQNTVCLSINSFSKCSLSTIKLRSLRRLIVTLL